MVYNSYRLVEISQNSLRKYMYGYRPNIVYGCHLVGAHEDPHFVQINLQYGHHMA